MRVIFYINAVYFRMTVHCVSDHNIFKLLLLHVILLKWDFMLLFKVTMTFWYCVLWLVTFMFVMFLFCSFPYQTFHIFPEMTLFWDISHRCFLTGVFYLCSLTLSCDLSCDLYIYIYKYFFASSGSFCMDVVSLILSLFFLYYAYFFKKQNVLFNLSSNCDLLHCKIQNLQTLNKKHWNDLNICHSLK